MAIKRDLSKNNNQLSKAELYQIYQTQKEICDHVWLNDDITTEQLKNIYYLFKTYELSESPAIIVHINSPGGHMHTGHSYFDLFRTYSKPVIGVVEYAASSAAAIALLGCDLRLAKPITRILFHQHSITLDSTLKTKDIKRMSYEEGLTYDLHINRMVDMTKMSRRKATNLIKGDKFLSGEISLKLGIIDYIIKPINRNKIPLQKKIGKSPAQMMLISIYKEPEILNILARLIKAGKYDSLRINNTGLMPIINLDNGIYLSQILMDLSAA